MAKKKDDYQRIADIANKEVEFLRAENKRKDTLLKQKDEEIQKQNTIIVGLEEQLRKSIDLIHDNDAPVNQKQLKIDELSEQLQVAKMEAAGYKEDFEQERRDREKLHSDLTNKLTESQGVARDLQMRLDQSVRERQHSTPSQWRQDEEIETLQKEVKTLREQKSRLEQLTTSLVAKGDKTNDLEEEKLVLTSQVKAYSRQCEELKMKLQEEQLQIDTLEIRIQGIMDSKARLLEAFQIEQIKVTELEEKLKAAEYVNKTIQMKLQESNNQLSKIMAVLPPEYQRILDEPHRQPDRTINSRSSLENKELLSGRYAPPQMTVSQMHEFAKNAERQREQDTKQLKQNRLRLLEEQRKREDMIADQALKELERAEQERLYGQGVRKPAQTFQTSYGIGTNKMQATGYASEVSLTQNIDQDIKFYPDQVCNMTRRSTTANIKDSTLMQTTEEVIQDYYKMMKRPSTNEVQEDNDSSIPYDPNLVCPKCGKKYRNGEIQKFKRHIKELCPMKK